MAASTGALALIPARGGSKGIAHKNLQVVGGIPLVSRCVLAALNSQRITRVVVTTDDAGIEVAAVDAGAQVVRRPADISGDLATSESALLHALNALEQRGTLESSLVFLQCTSPFTSGHQIDRVLAALDQPELNSSFAVCPWHGFLWRADGEGINHDPALPRQRRQDLQPAYLETGAIYAMRTAPFRRIGSRFCAPWQPVVLPDSGPEIDTPADLALCRSIATINAS